MSEDILPEPEETGSAFLAGRSDDPAHSGADHPTDRGADYAARRGDDHAARRSGDEAVSVAAERARETGTRNLPQLPGLTAPADTANLREGADLNHALLALLPMVGVWRGTGEGNDPDRGDYRFGQQIVVAHDGRDFLAWDSQTWVLDGSGDYAAQDLRESGFWRVNDGDGTPDEETLELLLTHSNGVVELYYGRALTQSSWEIATDVVIRSQSGAVVGGAKRLYGIVDGGDLAYVEERVVPDGPLEPRLSARLQRYIG